jgi:hypothetical protein
MPRKAERRSAARSFAYLLSAFFQCTNL